MDILMLTPYIPYPLTEGGNISQFATIDYLRKGNAITLVLTAYTNKDLENINELIKFWPDVDIQIINLISKPVNERKNQNLTSVIKRIVKKILTLPRSKTISDSSKVNISEFEIPYIIQLTNPKNKVFIEKLNRILVNKHYDLVQVDLIEFIDLVHLLPLKCKKVFVHHEIRFARLKSYLAANNIRPGAYEEYILSYVEDKELNLLKKYDGIITFSEKDQKKLQKKLHNLKVYNSPFPVLDSHFKEITPQNSKIEKLVFVGGENHYPNAEAIEWFVEKIGEQIKKLFSLDLYVIGNWSKYTISKYSDKTYINFAGFVPDLAEFCKNSIMLVPVRIGSGIRTKILYAMAQGTPVISTSLGCEGLPVTHKESIMIANSNTEFVEAVELLLTNKELIEKITINAQNIISSKYSQEVAGQLRNKYYQEIVDEQYCEYV